MPLAEPPDGVDHLVYAVPDLEKGRDAVEHRLGVRPALGGRHPRYGTHNALLSLGPSTYLEIIAPDPEMRRPERGVVFGADRIEAPRLVTWVFRPASIDRAAAAAAASGAGIGALESGSRTMPDGTVLSWRLSDPYAMPLGGAVPFLINWGDTPHPASSSPRAGDLVGIGIEHPHPERVEAALRALGVEVGVVTGTRFRLVARIATAAGVVDIS